VATSHERCERNGNQSGASWRGWRQQLRADLRVNACSACKATFKQPRGVGRNLPSLRQFETHNDSNLRDQDRQCVCPATALALSHLHVTSTTTVCGIRVTSSQSHTKTRQWFVTDSSLSQPCRDAMVDEDALLSASASRSCERLACFLVVIAAV